MSKVSKHKKVLLIVLILIVAMGTYLVLYPFNQKSTGTEDLAVLTPTSYLKTAKEFASHNYSNIDVHRPNIIEQLNILDNDTNSNDVFLTGENHGTNMNFELKLAFLKYFNQKAGIVYLLSESGYSSACYINKYLESGDEDNLKVVYNNLKGTASYNKEEYNFWINLRKYNLTLPQDQRIRVFGIDVEHQLDTASSYLNDLLHGKGTLNRAPLDSFQKEINFMATYHVKPFDFIHKARDLQKDIQDHPDVYKEYLGEDFFDFSMIVDNMINSIEYYKSQEPNGVSVI